jgi:hypothetical protein
MSAKREQVFLCNVRYLRLGLRNDDPRNHTNRHEKSAVEAALNTRNSKLETRKCLTDRDRAFRGRVIPIVPFEIAATAPASRLSANARQPVA